MREQVEKMRDHAAVCARQVGQNELIEAKVLRNMCGVQLNRDILERQRDQSGERCQDREKERAADRTDGMAQRSHDRPPANIGVASNMNFSNPFSNARRKLC